MDMPLVFRKTAHFRCRFTGRPMASITTSVAEVTSPTGRTKRREYGTALLVSVVLNVFSYHDTLKRTIKFKLLLYGLATVLQPFSGTNRMIGY